MNLKIKIYTTTKSKWFRKDLELIKKTLLTTYGRGTITFDIESISPPTEVPTIRDKDGDVRPSWDWFHDRFYDEEYNCVVLHISKYYKKKWGFSPRISGTYRRDNDDLLEFWLCADRFQIAKHYPFSEFARIFIHEMSHGDSHWTGVKDKTHSFDYNLRAIDLIHSTYSYRTWNLKFKIRNLLVKVKDLYGKLSTHPSNKK